MTGRRQAKRRPWRAPAGVTRERADDRPLSIRDEQDPYRYAEIRGKITAATIGQQAPEHVDELTQKYLGGPYSPENIRSERVMSWITPQRRTVVGQTKGVNE